MTRLLSALTVAFVIGVPAYGHHSFPAFYYEEKQITIEGVVEEFEYRAPHAWVHVSAPDDSGQMRRFSAEWANPSRLEREGITKDTLRAGDRVRVTGSPSRDAADYKLHLKQIDRPADGWRWNGPGRR